jgi:xanthine dehydrogenase accessory factor
MKEAEDIISAYDAAVADGKKMALATVVHVEGSSYRRPGARMLITEDGALTGAISGGCLEGDALRKALLVIMQQQSMLVTYDTSDEEDDIIGLGLGCNGIIQVLIEPIDPNTPHHPVQLLKIAAGKRQLSALLTLFSLENKKEAQPGTCMLLTAEGQLFGNSEYITRPLTAIAANAIQNGQSSFQQFSSAEKVYTVFVEAIVPAISLVIIGAGNDIQPLATMATTLGWKTTIIDGRPAYAKKERFPAACSVLLAKPEQVIRQVSIDARTAIVLMTHNYHYDMQMLRVLAGMAIKYTGMLGPRKKLERMLAALQDEGIVLSGAQLATIHSPVGLDIGAETPEEIALSILAEIQTVFAAASAVSLKDNTKPIHDRAALAIEPLNTKEK